jgi:hypothetical protein
MNPSSKLPKTAMGQTGVRIEVPRRKMGCSTFAQVRGLGSSYWELTYMVARSDLR